MKGAPPKPVNQSPPLLPAEQPLQVAAQLSEMPLGLSELSAAGDNDVLPMLGVMQAQDGWSAPQHTGIPSVGANLNAGTLPSGQVELCQPALPASAASLPQPASSHSADAIVF